MPSPYPTAGDTISVGLSFSIIATSIPTAAQKVALKASMARELNLDENSEMRRFTIEVKAIEGRRFRRDLLARVRRLATTYTWEVSFDAVKSLTSTGAEDADAWMENLATTITAGGFSVALSEDIGVTLHVDQDSISYYVITRSPTPAPSVLAILDSSSSASVNLWVVLSGTFFSLSFVVCLVLYNMKIGYLKMPKIFKKKELKTSHINHLFITEMMSASEASLRDLEKEERKENIGVQMSEATYEESPASTDSFFGNIHMTQESRMSSMIGISGISSSPVSAELSVGDQVQLATIDHRSALLNAEAKLAAAEASAHRAEERLSTAEEEEDRIRLAKVDHRTSTAKALRRDTSINPHQRRLTLLQDSKLLMLSSMLLISVIIVPLELSCLAHTLMFPAYRNITAQHEQAVAKTDALKAKLDQNLKK